MFFSYAVVPLFVFAALLNVFYLNPIHSLQSGPFGQCQECVTSDCFTAQNGTCMVNPNATDSSFLCYTCTADEVTGNQQFTTPSACNASCAAPGYCQCVGFCYMCIPNAEVDTTTLPAAQCPCQTVDLNCVTINVTITDTPIPTSQ